MQDTKLTLPRVKCPVCGKLTPKRDIRDTKPQYCSKICAGMARYKTRYNGTNTGPFDRPVDFTEKTKWKAGKTDDIPSGA